MLTVAHSSDRGSIVMETSVALAIIAMTMAMVATIVSISLAHAGDQVQAHDAVLARQWSDTGHRAIAVNRCENPPTAEHPLDCTQTAADDGRRLPHLLVVDDTDSWCVQVTDLPQSRWGATEILECWSANDDGVLSVRRSRPSTGGDHDLPGSFRPFRGYQYRGSTILGNVYSMVVLAERVEVAFDCVTVGEDSDGNSVGNPVRTLEDLAAGWDERDVNGCLLAPPQRERYDGYEQALNDGYGVTVGLLTVCRRHVDVDCSDPGNLIRYVAAYD